MIGRDARRHPAPAPHLTLKHVFPAISWIVFEPYYEIQPGEVGMRHVRCRCKCMQIFNDYAFGLATPDEYKPLPGKEVVGWTQYHCI